MFAQYIMQCTMSDERRLVSTNKGRGRAAVAAAEGSLYWVAILGYAGLLYCKSDSTWCYTASMLIQGTGLKVDTLYSACLLLGNLLILSFQLSRTTGKADTLSIMGLLGNLAHWSIMGLLAR